MRRTDTPKRQPNAAVSVLVGVFAAILLSGALFHDLGDISRPDPLSVGPTIGQTLGGTITAASDVRQSWRVSRVKQQSQHALTASPFVSTMEPAGQRYSDIDVPHRRSSVAATAIFGRAPPVVHL